MNTPFVEHGGTRTTSSTVTFAHPFRLGRDMRELPAGTYPLHIDEQLFSSGDRTWSARSAVVIEVRQGAATAFRHVAPTDLDQAMAADAATSASLQIYGETPMETRL